MADAVHGVTPLLLEHILLMLMLLLDLQQGRALVGGGLLEDLFDLALYSRPGLVERLLPVELLELSHFALVVGGDVGAGNLKNKGSRFIKMPSFFKLSEDTVHTCLLYTSDAADE